MWKSLLFGIYHLLKDYQAFAISMFSKRPAQFETKYGGLSASVKRVFIVSSSRSDQVS